MGTPRGALTPGSGPRVQCEHIGCSNAEPNPRGAVFMGARTTLLRRRHRHRVCMLKDIRRCGSVRNGREDQLART
eukprot:3688664-Alexandrium_andersonii.AAC.1